MALDEAIARYKNNAEHERTHGDLHGCLEFRQLAKWLEELKQLREQTRWIPVSEEYPKPEDEYKNFLTVDDKGKITLEEFYLSLDEEPQPYFSGMRQAIAWMPLPEPYAPDINVGKMAESEEKNET